MNIGPDEVAFEGERVIIRAAGPMDWPVREFCKVPILFQGRKYYLRESRKTKQLRPVVYELWPWPADLHEASPCTVVYDAAYAVERDKAAAKARRLHRIYLALIPLYPFLGLLWSGFKSRVLSPVGFEPGSITKISIRLTFNLFIAEGIFVGWLAGGILTYFLGWPTMRLVDCAVTLVLGVDSAMRFGQSLKFDVDEHWGFCEWLWPEQR